MIYPIPISQKFYDKASCVKVFDLQDSLFDFYKAARSYDINFVTLRDMEKEEYKIVIDEFRVDIFSSTDVGTYRAITSLRQICKSSKIFLPICEIEDKPDFERRSYMLDISRHKIPTVESILKIVDALSELKYNEFQLYMESFCFKYDAFPEYSKDSACLTAEDIRIIDKYCRERYIDLVPNQNSLGHMQHWLSKPELSHLSLSDGDKALGVLNPLLDESVELVDKIYGSLFPHFSSKYAHIGLDEAYGLGDYQTKEACEKYGMDTVFADYLKKINKLCNEKYGKEVMYWDDMIISYPHAFSKFPKNAIAVEWGYGIISTQFMEERCRILADNKVRFYVAPGTAEWQCLTSRTGVMEFNVRTAAELAKKYGAMGYMLTDWGMPADGHMQTWVNSLYPMTLAGQYAWNSGDAQDRQNFKHEFRYGAFDYLDKNVFGAKGVTEEIYRLGKYYHLEPHKVHGMTLCAINLTVPLNVTKEICSIVNPWPVYDLERFDDTFDFENVIAYVDSIQKRLEKIDFDELLKREILLTAKTIKLGAEVVILKITKHVSSEKKGKILSYLDDIIKEHASLWKARNLLAGLEVSLGILKERKKEIEELLP